MYINKNYGFWMTFGWSSKPFLLGLGYGFVISLLAYIFDLSFNLPWQPLSVIGIAVAFYLGFKNNSSYDRTWEARKIWGEIVNNSRSFGAAVCSFVAGAEDDQIKKELIYRHLAWLTALRFQLRLSKEWEHTDMRLDKLFNATVCENYTNTLDAELSKFISDAELKTYSDNSNKATQIMRKQAERLQELRTQNYFEDFRHMEFHHLISEFYNGQGKSERIKTFPFPRQYASTALWLTFVFAFLVPFGMLDVFKNMADWMYWLSPLLSALVIWVFFLMEKIGDYSENPFEGTYNDVPITAISRTIEIDLREMIQDENIPEASKSENGFLL
ncbi:putative membrane protein [Marivirga sericea]|uniref:Putative membrane protein n=1 Tax=Marivirga sericea TaxID=1028 RepID=A0A1X7JM76_9BACT|nr:bestrophin family ion channel [Marivirga sericea]SMG29321.1 putative membrane protein [Marivirga sericea]